MNPKYQEYLSSRQEEKLLHYAETKLKPDLVKFEETYGYKGNIHLAKWLMLNHMLGNETLPVKSISHAFLKHSFIRSIPDKEVVWKHRIENHYFEGFLGFFTPLFAIGLDGIGGSYHSYFFGKNNYGIFFCDHDTPSDFSNVLSFKELFELQPIANLEKVISLILSEKETFLGLDRRNDKDDFDGDFLNDEIREFMLLLQQTKPLHHLSSKYSSTGKANSPFVEKEELSELLTNVESDYYKYDNVRAYYNPLIATSLYWHYLKCQFSDFESLLEETKNIKGRHYRIIRDAFVALSEGNYESLTIKYGELNTFREQIEIPISKFVGFEQKHFAKEIEKIEQEKAKALAHKNDKYFKLNFMKQDWGVFKHKLDENSKSLFEQNRLSLEGLSKWENPEPIITNFAAGWDTIVEQPDLPDKVYFFGGTGFGQDLVVSEKVKNILEQYILPEHCFYPVQLNSGGELHPYYSYTELLDPKDTDYVIDFSKTKFQLFLKRKQKGKVLEIELLKDNVGFQNYSIYKKTLKEMWAKNNESYDREGNYAQLSYKFKDQEIYLTQGVDLFRYVATFYISNRLKQKLENSDLNLFTNYGIIGEYPDYDPFTKINLSHTQP